MLAIINSYENVYIAKYIVFVLYTEYSGSRPNRISHLLYILDAHFCRNKTYCYLLEHEAVAKVKGNIVIAASLLPEFVNILVVVLVEVGEM